MVELDMSKRPTSAASVKAELCRIATQHPHRLYAMPGAPASPPPYRPSFGVGQPPPAAWAQSAPSVQQAQIQLGFTPTPAPRKRGFSRRAATSMIILGIASVALLENVRTLWTQPYIQGSQPGSGSGPTEVAQQQFTFTYHANKVTSLDWSPPPGTYIASGSLDKTVRVWKQDFDGIDTIHTMSDPICAVGWSPDGAYIAAASVGKIAEVQIWSASAKSGDKPALTFSERSSGAINTLAWMPLPQPDGYHVAIGSDDGNIRLLYTGTSLLHNVATYQGPKGAVQSMAWSPDGTYLAAGGADTKVYVWPAKLESSPGISGFSQHTERVTAITWMNEYILSGSADRTAVLWDTNGNIQRTYHLPAPVTAVAYSAPLVPKTGV